MLHPSEVRNRLGFAEDDQTQPVHIFLDETALDNFWVMFGRKMQKSAASIRTDLRSCSI